MLLVPQNNASKETTEFSIYVKNSTETTVTAKSNIKQTYFYVNIKSCQKPKKANILNC